MDQQQLEHLKAICNNDATFEQIQQYLSVEIDSPKTGQQKALFRVITKIRESLDLKAIFKTTAIEVRQLLNADRVALFCFAPNSGWNDGEFVAEDVSLEFKSVLSEKVHDHCFGDQYAIDYHKERVQAVSDIQTAGLKDCHIEVLTRFQIRANLVVPVLEEQTLWGLLCIHQCSAPRVWAPHEIEFIQQVATHLGIALQQAKLLEKVRFQTEQHKALFKVITRIREPMDLATIFRTAATESRQLLKSDRVAIFRFAPDSNWNDGEFVSESVAQGYTSVLAERVHDHCFGDRYAAAYHQGQIQAVADIYSSGLQACHIEVLSRFQIRANLVVPLLQGTYLWGLLCIHQCAELRFWEAEEIEFARQIAAHLSVALQQAELLAKTQQQTVELGLALDHLKKAQTQLIQSEKMSSLGQLVAGIAHEINNPVNFIHGNISYAHRYAQDLMGLVKLYQQHYPEPVCAVGDRAEEIDIDFLMKDFPLMLASMQIGAERIRNIVLSLRNFSRLDEAEMKVVDLHEGLESTLLILQYRLKPKSISNLAQNIRLVKEYGQLPLVECYPSQLNQVFMNLLSNAIDALEEQIVSREKMLQQSGSDSVNNLPQPTITIRTELCDRHDQSDDLGDYEDDRPALERARERAILASDRSQDASTQYVAIRIADNGPGVPEKLQTKLFDPFFTTKPVGKGTGLGLSISQQIICERHHGTLKCISHPGRGTEFQVLIPIRQHELVG
ncbi:MAG: hypothetical protein Fur0046_14610 [Cyanobacteria bacterium J069]|nr:MAG: GAF domain-containing protein [Cyanobacteria bacterium J069]